MLSTELVVADIVKRIGWVYDTPLMYGGTADAVDVLLDSLHLTWAVCHEREAGYRQIRSAISSTRNHQAMSPSTFFARKHTQASQEQVAKYVVEYYQEIDERLGLEVRLGRK